MADYQAMYQSKLKTAQQVAAMVENGWVFGMDAAPTQADGIMNALADHIRESDIRDVKIHLMLDGYPFPFLTDDSLNGKMNGVSWFSGGGLRKAVNGGYADLIPGYYRDFPGVIRRMYAYDAYVVSVSPMDSHGYFSLATSTSYSQAMIDKARRIFVEVNEKQPRCLCGTQLHVSEVAAIVENTHDMPVLPPTKIDETSQIIGGLIADQIPNGACIQLGIGAIPEAVGAALMTKKHLGIHTEMFTSSMVDLLESGAANNSKKQIHRGKTVTTFAFGAPSQRMVMQLKNRHHVHHLI